MPTTQKEIDIEFDEDLFVPAYRHLLPTFHDDGSRTDDYASDINLLYGGRDSGKSHFVAQRLVMDCLTLPHFRCLMGKKTANSIKDSQWQTIKDVVEDWGLEELFTFTESPLKITCFNGNRFIARGFDDPKNIRSIRNVNRAWIEEGNQINDADFITMLTSLRSNDSGVQVWITFNPEAEDDYEKFWLYKLFYADRVKRGDTIYNCHYIDELLLKEDNGAAMTFDRGKPMVFRFSSTHTTYHDNLEYVTPLRRTFHESLKRMNEYYYNMFTLGIWTNMMPGQLWAFAYDRKRHGGRPELNRQEVVWLSFDFNRNPITCCVIQYYDGKVNVLQQIKLANSDIYKLCDYINARYPMCLFMVTGDATGKNSSALVQDNLNYYTVIQQKLRLADTQIDVPSVNPPLRENQVLVNAVLSMIPVSIHDEEAEALHYDLSHVQTLPDGSIMKGDRNDPTKQADSIDTFRYFANVQLGWVLRTAGAA